MIKQSSELRSLAMNLTPSYDTHTAADPQVLTKSNTLALARLKIFFG